MRKLLFKSKKKFTAYALALAMVFSNFGAMPVLAAGEEDQPVVIEQSEDVIVDAVAEEAVTETEAAADAEAINEGTDIILPEDLPTPMAVGEDELVGEGPKRDPGTFVLDVSDLENGTINTSKDVGKKVLSDGFDTETKFFTLQGTEKKSFTVDDSTKTLGDSSITKRLKTGGADRNIVFTTEYPATIEIALLTSSGTTKRSIDLYKGSSKNSDYLLKNFYDENSAATALTLQSFELTVDGTYLLNPSAAVNIYYIKVTEKSVTPCTVTPTISAGADLLTGGLKLSAKNGSNYVDLTSGTATDLYVSTEYSLVVRNADGSENAFYKVTVGDDTTTTFTTGAEATYALNDIRIVQNGASINFTLDEASLALLGASSKVVLTNTKTATDTFDLNTASLSKDLALDEKYNLSISGSYKLKATVGENLTEYTVSNTETTVPVTVSSLEKAVAVSVDETDGALGDATLTIKNKSHEDETYTLTNGSDVTLVLGQTYVITCSNENMFVSLNGNPSTEFTMSEDTAISIALELPIEGLYDFTKKGYIAEGLTTSKDYGCGVSVLYNMGKATSSAEIGGMTYKDYVVADKDGNPVITNNIPTGGAVLKVVPTQTGTLKVAVKIGANKQSFLLDVDSTGNITTLYDKTFAADTTDIISTKLEEGHTYYIYSKGSKIKIYNIIVDYRTSEAWNKVAAPVLGTPVVNNEDGTISVPYTAQVGGIYSDSLDVTMYKNGEAITTKKHSQESNSGEVVFTPTASGDYTFKAELVRSGETAKAAAAEVSATGFVLPLAAPEVTTVANQGAGAIDVYYNKVDEATGYVVYVNGEEKATSTKTVASVTGLTAGETYSITVKAVRGETYGPASEAFTHQVVDKKDFAWAFSVYGTSTNTANNGYEGNANDGTVTVYSENGKGKIVPGSTDGLAFYYVAMDPAKENFTLEADVKVDSWTLSNGQDGFGLMVADTIGKNGTTDTVWNNSIMNVATKIEYNYDGEAVTTDTSAPKISMKLGIGVISRLGVTAADVSTFKASGKFPQADGSLGDMPEKFTSDMYTLETSCASLGAGTYNIIGNYTTEPTGTQADKLVTTMHMSIQRNNTGYILKYTDAEGNVLGEQLIYDLERDALTKIDSDNIYVGFFASRNARITAENIKLTTIAPEDDEAAKEREINYIAPVYTIESASVSNSEDYTLVFYGNADGKLTVKDPSGKVLVDSQEIKAKTKVLVNTKLTLGSNTFEVVFTPNADYEPAEYSKLSSYEAETIKHTVTFSKIAKENVYVAPNGNPNGSGSRTYPLDIYTAVKYATPGQKIILTEGTYELTKTLRIERGIDGTADNMIYMIADPKATTRPVLDFMSQAAGMVIGGNYWYFQGFDVTRSADAQKGITLGGSNNVLDNLQTYRNGNTGIQISRFMGTDEFDMWPANNLVLNCTSYLNADKGYEDADGFAAKLTVGEGNVFDGCISAFNADDGWDLYAKVQSGSIGKVTIKNSIAFKNGYVLDAEGKEVNAGNGNGFKMGGESMTGYHTLIGSLAFANKAKGFDSNSCPDIQVSGSVSFDNESYNVAFYTNNASNTDFAGTNLISYKKSNDVAEQFKPKGTQDTAKYQNDTCFYVNGKEDSSNAAGTKVADDWFVSLDTSAKVAEFVAAVLKGNEATAAIFRNEDCTISVGDYLTLSETGKTAAGFDAGLYAVAAANTSKSQAVTVDTSKETKITEQFIDVAADSWYSSAIEYVFDTGLMVGTSTHSFTPDTLCTREMFVRILYNAAGQPATGDATNPFSKDVANGKWYTDAVTWAYANKVTKGMSSDTFGVGQFTTREQMAQFLYNYASWKGFDLSGSDDLSAFSDGKDTSAWAGTAVKWAVANGIMNGSTINGERVLRPTATATRGEAAQIITNFILKYGK